MNFKKEKLPKEERRKFMRELIFILISLCGIIFGN